MSTDTYHHGNLRRALLDAAWDLVARDGLDGLSLRAVAREAGVSHAAPAHHFKDKAGLIEALAVEGYERFERALDAAWRDSPHVGMERLADVGLAYIRFVQENPEAFRLMNRPELRGGSGSVAVREAAGSCGAVLERGLREVGGPGRSDADLSSDGMLAWTGVHGFAVLAIDGLLPLAADDVEAGQARARILLDAMARGLCR